MNVPIGNLRSHWPVLYLLCPWKVLGLSHVRLLQSVLHHLLMVVIIGLLLIVGILELRAMVSDCNSLRCYRRGIRRAQLWGSPLQEQIIFYLVGKRVLNIIKYRVALEFDCKMLWVYGIICLQLVYPLLDLLHVFNSFQFFRSLWWVPNLESPAFMWSYKWTAWR